MDDTIGYELLSFMDAFSGYNQIQIHPRDREMTFSSQNKAPITTM